MKCFERLVKTFITSSLPDSLDPLQFADRPNRSTDDANALTLHTALSHLDKRKTYVRILFIDYSSAFNTIVPSQLVTELRDLGFNTVLCGHNKPPEQLQCSLPSLWNSVGGMNIILPKDIPSFIYIYIYIYTTFLRAVCSNLIFGKTDRPTTST